MRFFLLWCGALTLSACFGSGNETRSGSEELVVESGDGATRSVTLEGSSARPMEITFHNLTPACARAWFCVDGDKPLDQCVEKLGTFETRMVTRAAFVLERLESSTIDGAPCGVARGRVDWVHPKAERRSYDDDDDD